MTNPNQPRLPGMPVGHADLTRQRNSLARTLTPEYLGIDPFDYGDITDRMRAAAEPEQLILGLVDVPKPSPGSTSAVSYWPGGAARSVNIAVVPGEYRLLVRGPDAFSNAVRNTTLQSRPIGDTHANAAERSVKHAHVTKFEAQNNYLHGTLEPWKGLLAQFRKAAKHPGLSLMGNEISMRTKFETLRSGVFENMFEALRVQRGWDDRQMDFARRTVEARMVIDREHNQHLQYFAGFVAMSQEYFGHKSALFMDRAYRSRRIVKRLEADEL